MCSRRVGLSPRRHRRVHPRRDPAAETGLSKPRAPPPRRPPAACGQSEATDVRAAEERRDAGAGTFAALQEFCLRIVRLVGFLKAATAERGQGSPLTCPPYGQVLGCGLGRDHVGGLI